MSEAFKPVDPVLDLLGGENVVAHRPSFARAFGGACVGLLLSQFWFYSRMDTSLARDGWFYASQEQIEEETGLTRTEQETARRKMREAGILAENKAGIPARLYFCLDKGRLVEQLRQWLVEEAGRVQVREEKKRQAKQERGKAAGLYAGFPQTGLRGSRKQERGEAAVKQGLNPQAIPKTSLKNTEKNLIPESSASLFQDKSPVMQAKNGLLLKTPDKKEEKKTPESFASLSQEQTEPPAVQEQTEPDAAQAEAYRRCYRQARRQQAHPDFKARHGRCSGPDDWKALAHEMMKEMLKGAGEKEAGEPTP